MLFYIRLKNSFNNLNGCGKDDGEVCEINEDCKSLICNKCGDSNEKKCIKKEERKAGEECGCGDQCASGVCEKCDANNEQKGVKKCIGPIAKKDLKKKDEKCCAHSQCQSGACYSCYGEGEDGKVGWQPHKCMDENTLGKSGYGKSCCGDKQCSGGYYCNRGGYGGPVCAPSAFR